LEKQDDLTPPEAAETSETAARPPAVFLPDALIPVFLLSAIMLPLIFAMIGWAVTEEYGDRALAVRWWTAAALAPLPAVAAGIATALGSIHWFESRGYENQLISAVPPPVRAAAFLAWTVFGAASLFLSMSRAGLNAFLSLLDSIGIGPALRLFGADRSAAELLAWAATALGVATALALVVFVSRAASRDDRILRDYARSRRPPPGT
jgi:hypothetical protein